MWWISFPLDPGSGYEVGAGALRDEQTRRAKNSEGLGPMKIYIE